LVKSKQTNGNKQTIISKRQGYAADGYDLKLVNNIISFNWNGSSIASTYPIMDRWYMLRLPLMEQITNFILME
jgi:hypothetical protein